MNNHLTLENLKETIEELKRSHDFIDMKDFTPLDKDNLPPINKTILLKSKFTGNTLIFNSRILRWLSWTKKLKILQQKYNGVTFTHWKEIPKMPEYWESSEENKV